MAVLNICSKAATTISLIETANKRLMSSINKKFAFKNISSNHTYRNLYPWKSKDQLANELYEKIIFNEGSLLAINKPYGVGIYPQIETEKKNRKPMLSGFGECEYNVAETLPLLQTKLGLDKPLGIIKSAERYSSGVILLSHDDSVSAKVSKCLRRSKSSGLPMYTYQTVVTNVPLNIPKGPERVGFHLVDIPAMKQKAPIIELKISKTKIKKDEMKTARVHLKLVSVNNSYNTALIELSTTTVTWHFIRVYLANKLAPILGDAMYSARVKMIMGRAIAISPHNSVCYDPPTLSDKLCNILEIPKENIIHIPAHIHLHQINLHKYFGKEDLIITAEPNERFLWTAKKLNLISETESSLLIKQN